MYAFDLLAAVALAGGALLGARRGFWKMLAGGTAVTLGAGTAWATWDVLAAALRDWGVGTPGDVVLGIFIPFALVSVYARFIIGLWLSKRLERRPRGNCVLGSAAGVVWVVLAAGFAARAAGLDPAPPAAARHAVYGVGQAPLGGASPQAGPWEDAASGPFTRWLARYPGELGAWMYLRGVRRGEGEKGRLTGTLKACLDAERAQRRASRADDEAFESLRRKRPVPLRVGGPATER